MGIGPRLPRSHPWTVTRWFGQSNGAFSPPFRLV